MKNSRFLILVFFAIITISCNGYNFMGAVKYGGVVSYIERWYKNPNYKFNIPSGTAFYGTAAEKIKDKFIIEYYIKDNKGSKTQIPTKDMWKVKHNGKRYFEQDDDDLFYYIKKTDGSFIKKRLKNNLLAWSVKNNELIAVKECFANDWCQLYPTLYPDTLYVKKSILYQ